MAEKDFQKRQDCPALDYIQPRLDFKLSKRKEKIQEILWEKRNPPETIKGYNLRLCWKKRPYKKKRCWCCGSINHLKIDCPVHKEKQLLLWVEELEKRITQMEEALHVIQKNRAKREERKKRRKRRKKKGEHKEEVRALTSAVKLKNWLFMEEKIQDLKNFSLADLYYRRIPKAGQNKIKKVYQKLFSRDLIGDFVDACTCGDELFEDQYESPT